MKKILAIFASAAAILACTKTPETYLTVSDTAVNFSAEGGPGYVFVNSNTSWTVTTDGQDWYTVAPVEHTGPKTLAITADPYIQAAGRSAQFTVSGAGEIYTITLVQARPAVPENPSETAILVRPQEQDCTVPLPDGYEVKASSDASFLTVSQANGVWTAHLSENATGENRTGNVRITTTDDQLLATVVYTQSWRNAEPGDFVVEEVFFSGFDLGNGRSDASDGDQYLKITNNTDELLYADGLIFAVSKYDCSAGATWTHPTLTDEAGVATIYQIPGNCYGSTVPVAPGKSVVIATSAQDFTENGGINLAEKAQFEFFDGVDAGDVDNPDVKDMTLWFKSSRTITMLHSAGNECYVIAFFPPSLTVESYMEQYVWIGTEEFWWNGSLLRSRDISGGYLIPNDWVIDGVNMGFVDNVGDLALNASIDAGYTGCAAAYNDATRFDKSVRRNTLDDGKYADTDNSTNDFIRGTTPSLKN